MGIDTRASDGSLRKFLSPAEIKSIATRLRSEGKESTVTPDEARVLINSWSTWRENVKRLLNALGDPGLCKVCGLRVMYCVTEHQRGPIPVDADGVIHLATCQPKPDHRAGKDN